MRKLTFCAFVLFISFQVNGQKADTIVTMRGKIIGQVKEVTPELIAYSNPNESVIYKIEKGAVDKICFGSGRIEKFVDLKTLANLRGAHEWEKVDVATTEYETKGLYKIDMVSAKATGTTVYSSVSKVQDRAFNKLKMASALLGGNLVYVKSEAVEGNIRSSSGGRTSRAQILGTVYCSQLLDTVEFKKIMESGDDYTLTTKIGLRNNDADIHNIEAKAEPVKINFYKFRKGFIYLKLTIGKRKEEIDYRVISYEDNKIVVSYKDGTAYYNLLLTER